MLRFAVRYGLVRMVGRRAMPALVAWDILVIGNRLRRIPIVDRSLRRGAGAVVGQTARGAGAVADRTTRRSRRRRPS